MALRDSEERAEEYDLAASTSASEKRQEHGVGPDSCQDRPLPLASVCTASATVHGSVNSWSPARSLPAMMIMAELTMPMI